MAACSNLIKDEVAWRSCCFSYNLWLLLWRPISWTSVRFVQSVEKKLLDSTLTDHVRCSGTRIVIGGWIFMFFVQCHQSALRSSLSLSPRHSQATSFQTIRRSYYLQYFCAAFFRSFPSSNELSEGYSSQASLSTTHDSRRCNYGLQNACASGSIHIRICILSIRGRLYDCNPSTCSCFPDDK